MYIDVSISVLEYKHYYICVLLGVIHSSLNQWNVSSVNLTKLFNDNIFNLFSLTHTRG